MGTISFNNHVISGVLKDKLLLKTFLSSIFAEERFDFKSVSYVFCTDEFLLKLNQEYLKHDTLTDILTFTLSGTSLPIVSEIYISVERVRENAQNLDVKYEDELHRVMIHGILHLCGYSDHSPKEKAEMRSKEDYYLSKL
ncbi:MAG TPA: rRNA maturation RNase YbeY [Hanamia sp.]|nr:rRNA maturation RNase YbeY [Hanamia sp.]